MNAKEFMIGDWVRDAGRTDRAVYKRINRVDERENDCVADEYKVILGEAGMEPIPITPEILTANGFEKKENHSGCHYANYIDHSPVYAEQTIGDQWEIDIYQNGKIEMCVRYVHELQHILRLQGLTDFADQFKVKGGQP